MDDVDFTLKITCLAAPFQAEGKAGDIEWGYRSRHGRFSLTIGIETITGPEPEDDLKFIMDSLSETIIGEYVRKDDEMYDAAVSKYYGG
jgi:hypothetical protein